MKKIKLFQVDAFTDKVFRGNPAAVCVLDEWLDETTMQNIASENNLAETAFVVRNNDDFEIRWFTPKVEVDLCGHATLASAHVLFNNYNYPSNRIIFQSRNRGELSVEKNNDLLTLDFPADKPEKIDTPDWLVEPFNISPQESFKGRTDYLLVYSDQQEIENISPDFGKLGTTNARGVIVTAPGDDVDFVSRFFAPQVGINEDPVTGSAHTTLTPFWSQRLDKKKLTAKQLSERKGYLGCELAGDRVKISGKAVTYLIGEIFIP